MANANTARIRDLNDAFRKNPTRSLGRLMITASVAARGDSFVRTALEALAKFDTFTPDNDPHREHDFGIFDAGGVKLYFKIDYFDAACQYGSEDPSDPAKTTRVMTIMLPEDY